MNLLKVHTTDPHNQWTRRYPYNAPPMISRHTHLIKTPHSVKTPQLRHLLRYVSHFHPSTSTPSSLPGHVSPPNLQFPRVSNLDLIFPQIATMSSDSIPAFARATLHGLAAQWADVEDCENLAVVRLKGAMTNEVYQVKWPTTAAAGGKSRKVLVRIYGEGVDVFFDRQDEIRTFECMSKHGQGPKLLGRFTNGRIEEFINARTLSACDLRDPEISALIASKLREFHDLNMPGPRTVFLWIRLRKWIKDALRLCPSEEAKEFDLDTLNEEITALENILSAEDQKIGFCHNDLQYGNIMIDEESRQVTLIDYEYASFNPVAFDIANHFCEMAADYHTETPHVLDYSKCPDFEERRRFLQNYYSSSGETSTDLEAEKLLLLVEKYALVSHLFWGLWGIISEHVNKIDFDYKEYAKQRFQQYWRLKPTVFG